MVFTLRFFSSKSSLFDNSNVFGSCIIHIIYIGCAKIKKNNSGAKSLMQSDGPRVGRPMVCMITGTRSCSRLKHISITRIDLCLKYLEQSF